MNSMLNIQGINAYTKVMAHEVEPAKTNENSAIKFQEIFAQQFDEITSMTGQEISNAIQISQESRPSYTLADELVARIKDTRKAMETFEKQARKAAVGQTSALELGYTLTEAKQSVHAMTSIINEMSKALEKILSIAL